eukprot:TCONS_00019262-protein
MFLLIIIGYVVFVQGQKEAKFLNPQDNKKIQAHNQYLHLRGLSEVQCVGHCTLTDDCHSVNHHGDDQICLVIDEPLEGVGDSHLVDARGWRYFKKSKVNNVIPTKSEFKMEEAFIPEQNRLINIVPVQGKEWRVTLEVIVHQGSGVEYNEIFRMTSDPSESYGPARRIPLITTLPNKNEFAMHVHNGQIQKSKNVPFQLNQWYSLEINHYRIGPRRSMIIWHADGVEKYRVMQDAVPELTNVHCFTAGNFQRPIKGQIRNLKFVQGQEKLKGFSPQFNGIIETTSTWPKEWYVEIKLAVHSLNSRNVPGKTLPDTNDNIFHFTSGTNINGYGSRFPALWTRNSAQRLVIYFDQMLDGGGYYRAAKTFSLTIGQVYHIRIEHKLKAGETNIYKYKVQIDNNIYYHFDYNPPELSTMNVYLGDVWYKPTDATISYFDYGPL